MQVFGQDIRKVIGLIDSDTKLEQMPNRPRAYGGGAAVWFNGVAESGGALNPPSGGNEDQQDGVDGNADPANNTSNTTGAGGTGGGNSDVSGNYDPADPNPDEPPNDDPFPPLGGNAGGFMGGLGDCGDPDGRCINVRWDGQTPLPDGWEYQQDPDRDSGAKPQRPNWGFAPSGGWSGKCCQRFSYNTNISGSRNPCFLTMSGAHGALKAALKGAPWVCGQCGCESNDTSCTAGNNYDGNCGVGSMKFHDPWIITAWGSPDCPVWQGGGGHIAESCQVYPNGCNNTLYYSCNVTYSGNSYEEKVNCPCLNPAQYPNEYPDYKKLPDGYCSEISFGDDYQFHNSYGDADRDNKVIEGDDTENSVTLCDEDGIPVTFSADLNGVKITKNGHYVVVDPKTNKVVDKGTV